MDYGLPALKCGLKVAGCNLRTVERGLGNTFPKAPFDRPRKECVMDQIDYEILRFEKTVQLTLEIAADKAKDAAIMRDDPLAILCWACAAKEVGDWALKAATLKKIKPADSANSDVNGTVWEKMKTCLCESTAMTPNEVEQLGMHLRTDTKSSDQVPELRQLHERALDKLKNHAHLIADKMIETLRDAKFQLVASDFLAQERAVFMRKQSKVMQQQEEARQNASEAAGDAVVYALEEFKRQNDAAKSFVPELVANTANKVLAEIQSQGSTVLLNRQEQPNKLPLLKNWAMEAWKAKQFGMPVIKIATTLSEKYKDPKITQPRVSEQIKIARMHAETSGLATIAANVLSKINSRAPARTLDPFIADLGNHSDGRSHLVRDKEKQKAKDGDDD